MITIEKLNPHKHQVNPDILSNLDKLSFAMTMLEQAYMSDGGDEFIITSGYRTREEQKKINPTTINSAHIFGLACDVADIDKKIWDFCIDNLHAIAELDLYLEDKLYTQKHVHFQMRAPRSGKRIFIP